jgi:cellulose synthase/poly-beta-1,6-N-acetylglucosamine synthase-like glycosyltransferase
VFILSIYHLASFSLNLFYRQFDLKQHFELLNRVIEKPAVDIYLPICGEELSILENTWKFVDKIDYKNRRVYVLDDSKNECLEHRKLAEKFGFNYFERPNKGEMKKAGNLKYAYERTQGEFIVIFDADFAPHQDFLNETLPYMEDPAIGIVQTPQYFEKTPSSYKKSHLAYNAAFAEEPFYRFIQVTRSRFGGTICCGSNAVYRRSALQKIGGPYQIDYSEDAHTGYAITRMNYKVLFVPILLAIGLCPDNQYAFFHQQHRWCMGSMRLMLSSFFWKAKISWKIKFCYITGFMFYMHHILLIIFSFQLFWTLFFYNEYIPMGNSWFYIPHIIFAVVYVWLFPIAKLHLGYFNILISRTYAYSHAVKTALLRKSVGWVSTNAKHTLISPAFRQTTNFVTVYVLLYSFLIILGFRSGDIHLLDSGYWSVQFWIFWNLILSIILFFQQVKTMKEMAGVKVVASSN